MVVSLGGEQLLWGHASQRLLIPTEACTRDLREQEERIRAQTAAAKP